MTRCEALPDERLLRCSAPPDVRPPWPVIFYLHGVGERGDDPRRLLTGAGLPRALAEAGPDSMLRDPARFPYLVAAPQCPRDGDAYWKDRVDEIVAHFERVAASPGVDADRIVLAGFSMGADGAWAVLGRLPRAFRAVVAVAGRVHGDPAELARDLAAVPSWIAYHEQDDHVSRRRPAALLAALAARGAPVEAHAYRSPPQPPFETPHAWVGHCAFVDASLYDWLARVLS